MGALDLTVETNGAETRAAARVAADDVVHCSGTDEVESVAPVVAARLQANGYCIVQAWDTDSSTLQALVRQFGSPQSHVRADEHGVVEISPRALEKNPELDASQYSGTSTSSFDAHTDGSYLHGFLRVNGRLRRIGPPRILALQCVRPAPVGGESILIDGQDVLRTLVLEEPWHARILLRRGCVTFCRDDQLAMDFPVFERVGRQQYRLRYRYDGMLYVQHWSKMSLDHLQERYMSDPRSVRRVRLEEGQILFNDNYRMLHGRGSLPSGPDASVRMLRRMWISGEDHAIFASAVGTATDHRAYRAYEPYRVLDGRATSRLADDIQLGIRTSRQLQALIDRLTEDDTSYA